MEIMSLLESASKAESDPKMVAAKLEAWRDAGRQQGADKSYLAALAKAKALAEDCESVSDFLQKARAANL